jgi:DNA-binding response OmpR family regulator
VSRILVIEDDDQTRRMLRQMMERAGHEVIDAPNGEVALELFRDAPADLVITDILMPERDGIETIRDFRREFPEVKIIAISGGGRDGVMDFLPVARQLGACRTFNKPAGRQELLTAIDEELSVGAARDA